MTKSSFTFSLGDFILTPPIEAMKAGDRAPKFPFNSTDYVHVGEEIILREGSNLKGSRGFMPISAHLIQSYVNAIDESKRKYAAEHKIECNREEKTENTNNKNDENKAEDNIVDEADENIEDKFGWDTEENTEENSEENTVDNTEEMTEEKAEMFPETVATNEISEVESKPGEYTIENIPIPDRLVIVIVKWYLKLPLKLQIILRILHLLKK